LASAGEAWRQNSAAHDEILAYIPQLYGLVSKPGLFEPLPNASKSFQGRHDTTVDVLADQFTNLVGAGAKALRYLGMSTDLTQGDPERWKAKADIIDPYIRFATHHGWRWRPKSKLGPEWELTFGWKNHFYKTQIEQERLLAVEFGKFVVRVGCSIKGTSGHGFKAQFQLDFESPRLSKSVLSPFKQAALTLRYFKSKSFSSTSDTGYASSYYTTSQLGGGLQNNLPSTSSFADTWGDVLQTFDLNTKDSEKAANGWTFNLCARLGFDSRGDRPNKVFVFSKWRYAPVSRMGNPDIRVRIFGRCNTPKVGKPWCLPAGE